MQIIKKLYIKGNTLPFFFNNENIEVIMEDNPDDIFNPSDINHEPTSRNTTIRQLISQEIIHTFETNSRQVVVGNGDFINIKSLKEDNYLSYLFTFESNNEEYEIIYHIPFSLASVLEFYSQNTINEIKTEIDEDMMLSNKEIFLSMCNAIVGSLNAQEFSFLQDIELIDLYEETVENDKSKNLQNLYALPLFMDKKEYTLYLQIDKEFNKIF